MDQSDKQLVENFLNGESPAFEALLQRHLKPVYNFLAQMTSDRAALDDLTQETFIKAWKNLKRYDSEKSFKTWLFTIAKNTAYDFFKKKKTLPFSDFLDEEGNNPLENMKGDQILPDEILEKSELKQEFEKILQTLPDLYRAILILRYKEDFSLLEIAEILNIPYNTVKSRHQRALLALRKNMQS